MVRSRIKLSGGLVVVVVACMDAERDFLVFGMVGMASSSSPYLMPGSWTMTSLGSSFLRFHWE